MTKKKTKQKDNNLAEQITEPAKPHHKNIPIDALIRWRNQKLTHQEIVDLAGCSKANVTQRLKPFEGSLATLNTFRENRVTILETLISQILSSLSISDLNSMTAPQKVVAAGILIDKQLQIEGKNGGNSGNNTVQVYMNFSGKDPKV